MSTDIAKLGDREAVQALSDVAQAWLTNRGVEAFSAYHGVRELAASEYDQLPDWAKTTPAINAESGAFARQMLEVLSDANDEEVRLWTAEAVVKNSAAQAHVEPVTLAIGGAILIGAILAARVRKIGSVTFYKGIPNNLAKVLKAGAGLMS